MTITNAISNTTALTGQVVDNATLVRWLSELDGQLALEFYKETEWTAYDPISDLSTQLRVPHPYDGLYVHYLAAKTYFADGEYDRYENERVLQDAELKQYTAFLRRTGQAPCNEIPHEHWNTMCP